MKGSPVGNCFGAAEDCQTRFAEDTEMHYVRCCREPPTVRFFVCTPFSPVIVCLKNAVDFGVTGWQS